MRTHIVGIENHYYRSTEEKDAGAAPSVIRQLVARNNGDGTWSVSRTMVMPVPGIEAVPLKIRLLVAGMTAASPTPAEYAKTITRTASLREAFNLVRADEEKPERVPDFPVLHQIVRPEDTNEYWRNMPQPV